MEDAEKEIERGSPKEVSLAETGAIQSFFIYFINNII